METNIIIYIYIYVYSLYIMIQLWRGSEFIGKVYNCVDDSVRKVTKWGLWKRFMPDPQSLFDKGFFVAQQQFIYLFIYFLFSFSFLLSFFILSFFLSFFLFFFLLFFFLFSSIFFLHQHVYIISSTKYFREISNNLKRPHNYFNFTKKWYMIPWCGGRILLSRP